MTSLANYLKSGRKHNVESCQRGAVLVETALVFPLVVFFTLSIFEFGLYWRNDLSLSVASKEAARAAAGMGRSVTGDGDNGDAAALAVIHEYYRSGAIASVQTVVIYKPTITSTSEGYDYLIPSGCAPTNAIPVPAGGANCTVYSGTELQLASANFDPSLTLSKATGSGGWSVLTRCDKYSTVLNSQPDLIGVLVRSNYRTATAFPILNMLDGAQTVNFVQRIEPQNQHTQACVA